MWGPRGHILRTCGMMVRASVQEVQGAVRTQSPTSLRGRARSLRQREAKCLTACVCSGTSQERREASNNEGWVQAPLRGRTHPRPVPVNARPSETAERPVSEGLVRRQRWDRRRSLWSREHRADGDAELDLRSRGGSYSPHRSPSSGSDQQLHEGQLNVGHICITDSLRNKPQKQVNLYSVW